MLLRVTNVDYKCNTRQIAKCAPKVVSFRLRASRFIIVRLPDPVAKMFSRAAINSCRRLALSKSLSTTAQVDVMLVLSVYLTSQFLQCNVKVAVLGASGGIGQPMSLLMKQSPLISEISLYDIVLTPGKHIQRAH